MATTRTQMEVVLGEVEKPLGRLIFVKDGVIPPFLVGLRSRE